MNGINLGFTWHIERVRLSDGAVLDSEVAHNLVPVEGLNHIISVALKNGVPFANFYVGLYEGAYTPVPTDKATTFPAAATELTAYEQTTRQPLVLGTVDNGTVDNVAAKAEFTGTTNGKFAQGGFISSAPTKGAATGVLISAVKFPSPKPLDAGTILRVTAGFSAISI